MLHKIYLKGRSFFETKQSSLEKVAFLIEAMIGLTAQFAHKLSSRILITN